MIIDSKFKNSEIPNNFDIIIIGAGLSGLFLANELLNSNKKILIVDRGNENTNELNELRTENIGHLHKSSQNQDNFILGGHSSNWGGQLAEFESIDFEHNLWGLDFDRIKKYYHDIYNEFKIDKSNFKKKELNKYLRLYNTVYMNNSNLFLRFKNKIENSKNILLIKNLIAFDLEIKNETATKLICKNRTNINFQFNSKKFIFNMGTFENIRFFLNLKRKYKNFQKLKIGNYFHDHIGIEIAEARIYNIKNFRKIFSNEHKNNLVIRNKISFIRQSLNQIGISGEFINKEDDKNFNLARDKIKNLKKRKNIKSLIDILSDFKNYNNYKNFLKNYVIDKKAFSFPNKLAKLYIQSEQFPLSESRAEITDEILKDGLPKMQLNWKFSGREFDQIINFTSKIDEFLQKNNLAKLNLIINNQDEFYQFLSDTNHPSGGLLMSKNSNDGFCDINQKIWNTNNLYINGPCIFPNSSYANVGLNVLAITKKLAQSIKS